MESSSTLFANTAECIMKKTNQVRQDRPKHYLCSFIQNLPSKITNRACMALTAALTKQQVKQHFSKNKSPAKPRSHFHSLLIWLCVSEYGGAREAAVCDLSDPVTRGSGGWVLWSIFNVGEQPFEGCQNIQSRIMNASRASLMQVSSTQWKGFCR